MSGGVGCVCGAGEGSSPSVSTGRARKKQNQNQNQNRLKFFLKLLKIKKRARVEGWLTLLEVNHICIEKAVDIVMIVDLLRLARHSHRSEYARACSREVFVGSGVVCIMDVFNGVEQTLSRVTGLDLFRGRFLAVHVPCGVRINKQHHRNFAGRTHQRWPWQIASTSAERS